MEFFFWDSNAIACIIDLVVVLLKAVSSMSRFPEIRKLGINMQPPKVVVFCPRGCQCQFLQHPRWKRESWHK